MEFNAFHIGLGGIATLVSILGGLAAMWRFTIKPKLDAQHQEQSQVQTWRRKANDRIELLREFAVPDDKREQFERLWAKVEK